MNSEFDIYKNYSTEFVSSKSAITREMISQYVAAGILFLDEVCHAERILRRLNTVEQQKI